VAVKATWIVLAVVVIGGYLWFAKPWEPKRYDDSVQGQQAKKTDGIVDRAIRNKSIWEAREMLKSEPVLLGHKVYSEYAPLVEELYTAGATQVAFAYIVRSVRVGDQAEGLYAVLPQDPAKRKALIKIAQSWPNPPKDVNQKYIYMRIHGWDVNAPEPSFLGTE
jgi:hypothetical protein